MKRPRSKFMTIQGKIALGHADGARLYPTSGEKNKYLRLGRMGGIEDGFCEAYLFRHGRFAVLLELRGRKMANGQWTYNRKHINAHLRWVDVELSGLTTWGRLIGLNPVYEDLWTTSDESRPT